MVGFSTPQPQRDSRQSATTNSGAAARADVILTPIEWRSADNHGGRDARGAAARADVILTPIEWRSADNHGGRDARGEPMPYLPATNGGRLMSMRSQPLSNLLRF
jgi:hypothetical protein